MDDTRKARIAYDGPAIANGEMEIKELAPALLSFADLVEHANNAIGGEQKIKVLLNQDSIHKGSFDITFLVTSSFLEQVKLFVGYANDTGLTALMEVLGWGVTACGSIFWLIQKIAGRKIKVIDKANADSSIIILADGEKITVNNSTLKVYMDVDCRKDIEGVVKPLMQDGVELLELRNPARPEIKDAQIVISNREIKAFEAPLPASETDLKEDTEGEMFVKLISVNFEMGKWRLSDGTNQLWATMADEEFNDKVRKGKIAFVNGDTLAVKYIRRQTIRAGNLSTEYTITKVIEHRHKPQQIQLEFEQ